MPPQSFAESQQTKKPKKVHAPIKLAVRIVLLNVPQA
jgi:hypothetical protein